MPKVLLVEDDNNLREIFQMRLEAEGYQVATAADGEEGLVTAMKEKPDLLIADVMMPKLSGFEMVENLRSAPEMKNTKVIMMTALGQAEDQARGEKLGVVKYLVKSQVTLEDFARVVKEVLGPGTPGSTPAAGQPENQSTNNQESEKSMQDDPSQSNPAPAPSDSPAPADPAAPAPNPMSDTGQQSSADEQAGVQSQIDNFASTPAPAGDSMPAPAADSPAPADPAAPAADTSGMPPAPTSEPPAAPSEPSTGTDQPPASAPTDPTSNAL